jgi:hypothetical protein
MPAKNKRAQKRSARPKNRVDTLRALDRATGRGGAMRRGPSPGASPIESARYSPPPGPPIEGHPGWYSNPQPLSMAPAGALDGTPPGVPNLGSFFRQSLTPVPMIHAPTASYGGGISGTTNPIPGPGGGGYVRGGLPGRTIGTPPRGPLPQRGMLPPQRYQSPPYTSTA